MPESKARDRRVQARRQPVACDAAGGLNTALPSWTIGRETDRSAARQACRTPRNRSSGQRVKAPVRRAAARWPGWQAALAHVHRSRMPSRKPASSFSPRISRPSRTVSPCCPVLPRRGVRTGGRLPRPGHLAKRCSERDKHVRRIRRPRPGLGAWRLLDAASHRAGTADPRQRDRHYRSVLGTCATPA